MRLHQLGVTAFGPFAEPVTVDFDALSEASVFLLCGDTGAGKSTVLDAVCFALYGDVPSERSAAKQLRSHHAADGVPPQVVLEATLAGRRFRFTRSPAWQRPKRRGTGLTTQQASVLVEERCDGAWVLRSNRLDEAGQLVTDLLGMTLVQFSQVVLLPQGQFDTFLRASSEERHAVLTRLFRTSRFEDVERWLAERRTSLRRASERQAHAVTHLLHRLSEVSSVELPAWVDDLARACDDGAVESWCEALRDEATARQGSAAATEADAGRTRAAAETAYDAGLRVASLQARHRRAVRLGEELARRAEQDADDRARLEAARRAAPVLPLAVVAAESEASSERATACASEALRAVAAVLGTALEGADHDALAAHARDATSRAAVARQFLPRARELEVARSRTRVVADRLAEQRRQVSALADRVETLPLEVADLEAGVAVLQEMAAGGPAAALRVAQLGTLLTRLATRVELEHQVEQAQRSYDEQHGLVLDLRDRWLVAREQRLTGMAAELAEAVAVGEDCPVCGSTEHPALARSAPGAPSRAREQELRTQVDDAEVALVGHRDRLRGYQARLAAVREELADHDEPGATTALQAAEETLTRAERARVSLPQERARLDVARTSLARSGDELASLRAEVRVSEEQLAGSLAVVDGLVAGLAELLGHDGDAEDLARLVRVDEEAAALLSAARDALTERTGRADAARAARSSADRAAVAAGFGSLDAALAAELEVEAQAQLDRRTADRARLAAEVGAILDDPDVAAAAGVDNPDVPWLEEDREAARAAATAAGAARQQADHLARRTTARADALGVAVRAWAPVRAEAAAVGSLAELVEGKGVQNRHQMRLSAYVLAARLAQVVAAANERLTRMTDDRYELEHTDRRGVGERRGGLSLAVLDHWTDERRDPVTLSGGETFVVSLALALGLADVVSGETGGVRMETLFVDEGFGSLDSDTLELVMDTLDQLREGGRVVGVVSHVPELRTRIPTQLLVRKGRSGSTVQQCRGVG